MCYTVNLVLKPNSPCFLKLFSVNCIKFVSNYLANHIFSPVAFCVENAKYREVARIIKRRPKCTLPLGWPVNFVPTFQFFLIFLREVARIIKRRPKCTLPLGWPVNFVPTFQFFLIFLFLWLHHVACRILVPWPGVEPGHPAVEAQSPNLWTTRELPPTFQLLITMLLRQYQWKWKISDWIIKMKKTKQSPRGAQSLVSISKQQKQF